jgi:DNA-binding MarR family transcriptional regulator
MVVHLTDKGRAMREPLAAMWRVLEEISTQYLSTRQIKAFVDTAWAVVAAINGRDQTQQQPT